MIFWIIAAAVFFFGVLPVLILSSIIYTKLLIRTSKKKWGRECSIPEDEEYLRMFNEGIKWDEKYRDKKIQVDIKNGRFHLFGEYFNFGGDKAVIIIAGRMESLLYSYFFAEAYRAAGYNVLVIDNRAHGLSSGIVNSLGYREYKDILAWGKFLHEKKGNNGIVLHGICIGASTALFALTNKRCPDYFSALVAEGMYPTFGESFKNHMREDDHPIFPFAMGTEFYMWAISGANVVTDGPIKRIRNMQKPILFLHSKKDVFSTPDKAELLYSLCPSKNKKIVWFDKGIHSRIRINNAEKYDKVIIDFLKNI
ncbi:MAG: alpha/beta hydrolase [Clostridia bacterium]|nr:alpha/beta hydrolase [Clostridia bacterium]